MTPYVPMFNPWPGRQPPRVKSDLASQTPPAAGFPSPAESFAERELDLNRYLVKHPAATFFLGVKGEALLEAGIRHGDLVIVDRSLDPAPPRVERPTQTARPEGITASSPFWVCEPTLGAAVGSSPSGSKLTTPVVGL